MYQLAQQKVRRPYHQHPMRTVEYARPVGKTSLTQGTSSGGLGTPDYYTRAIESAMREIVAVRNNALPALVAVRRNRELASLATQIELARVALQVRYLLLAANTHVVALEKAQSHKGPMVRWLRVQLDRMITRSSKLGAYDNAEDMRPQRFIEPKARPLGRNRANLTLAETVHALSSRHEDPLAMATSKQVMRVGAKSESGTREVRRSRATGSHRWSIQPR
jgi:hypothetical protein